MRSCWIIVLKTINTTKCIISPAVNSHVVCWCPSQRLWADSKYNPSCGLHRSEPAHIQPLIIQTRPTAPRTVCSEISSGSPALSSSLALLSAVKPFHFEGHESWAASFRATDCVGTQRWGRPPASRWASGVSQLSEGSAGLPSLSHTASYQHERQNTALDDCMKPLSSS